MSIKSKDVIGTPVITIVEGKKIGKISDIIYDPQKQRVSALEVGGANWFSDAKILLIEEVKSIGPDAVLIDSEASLRKLVDVDTSIARIAQNDHYLTQSEILTEEGNELGKVTDIYFDSRSGIVESFAVEKPGKDAGSPVLCIPVGSIITVGEDATIVRATAEPSFGFSEKKLPIVPVHADQQPVEKPDDILTNIDPLAQIQQQSTSYHGFLGGKSQHKEEEKKIGGE